MKTTDRVISAKKQSKKRLPQCTGGQIDAPKNAISSCLRSEELFSKDSDSPETTETFSTQSHCNNPDDRSVPIESRPMTVTIPDELIAELAADFGKGGHRDNPGKPGRIGTF